MARDLGFMGEGTTDLSHAAPQYEVGSYLRLIDLYHSTLGLRVIKKEEQSRRTTVPGHRSAKEEGGSGRLLRAR